MITVPQCNQDTLLPESTMASKRQRKPSQFASSINSLKNQQERSSRKTRAPHSCSSDTILDEQNPSNICNQGLPCILSSGKKINLSIIANKKQFKKIKKLRSNKKISEKQTAEAVMTLPSQPALASQNSMQLLSFFLQAAQQLNKPQQSDKGNNNSRVEKSETQNRSVSNRRLQMKKNEKSQADKFQKFYEKSSSYESKIQSMLKGFAYL